jgi:GntR family transcriptional regulator/MocR family aminotransferase
MSNSREEEWSNSTLDLFLDLGIGSRPGLRARIEEGLRDAIREGRLRAGARLPATRALARDLNVSRGTVVQAYAQLAAEGWIAGRRGSATAVVFDGEQGGGRPSLREPGAVRWRFDLRPGRPDASSFPRAEWLRALRRALVLAPDDVLGYGSAQGQLALRNELAGYLARARGLRVRADSLLVSTGFTQSLGLIARALEASGAASVAMEEPSMPLHRAIVRSCGLRLRPLGVDAEGLRVRELERWPAVDAVVLTPNRQHPTGVTLSPRRRSRLLGWARAHGSIVVEDDYDGEFRYEGHPIGPLQSLDPASVVYAGTVSKTLAPGLRLGWLALPERLRQAVVREKERADWQSGALEQLALAELLRSGAYDRHIRRMRLRYRRRRDLLLDALRSALPGVELAGTAAGLNLLVRLRDATLEAEILAAASSAGIGLEGLVAGGYYERSGPAGIIVGYAAVPEHCFRVAAEALVTLLARFLGRARSASA